MYKCINAFISTLYAIACSEWTFLSVLGLVLKGVKEREREGYDHRELSPSMWR